MTGKKCKGSSLPLKALLDKGTQPKNKGPRNVTEELRALSEISIAVASMRDLKEILKKIADVALPALATDVTAIFLVDEARHALVGTTGSTRLGADGFAMLEEAYGATLTELEFPLERGTALIVDTLLDGRPRLGLSPLWLKETSRYEGIIPLLDTAEAAFGAITISMVPLMARERPLGVIVFLSPQEIHPLDKELIHGFASLAAVSIDNARAYQNLKTLNEQIIDTLAAAIETRDPYTSGHSFKVTQWSIAIAESMGLPAEEIEDLQLVGPLHDLGKIAVPDTILNKPTLLNDAEQTLVAAHPVIGANLMAKIDALAHLVPIIRHHHERYDGKGYPDKLKREDIPLFARILAVAVARRLVVLMAHGPIYPNLYILWIAPTTLYAKTTAMNLTRALADEIFPELLAPQDSTPEALLHDLAGLEPTGLDNLPRCDQDLWQRGHRFAGQKGLIVDEFSGLLATAGRKYGAGLVEALVRFYDCDPLYRRSTRGSGWVVVRNSYLSVFGASTPAALRKALLTERLWSNGWWPRFALLVPESRRPWAVSADMPRPPELVERVRRLYEALPQPSGRQTLETSTVRLGRGVHDAWLTYNKAMRWDLQSGRLGRLSAYYARLPTKALKVGSLLAALEWARETVREEGPTIELRHWHRAQAIVETWRASAHGLLAAVAKSGSDVTMDRVRTIVARAGPEGMTLRDIKRRMQDRRAREVERAAQHLVDRGALEHFSYKPPRGRSTVRYRIP